MEHLANEHKIVGDKLDSSSYNGDAIRQEFEKLITYKFEPFEPTPAMDMDDDDDDEDEDDFLDTKKAIKFNKISEISDHTMASKSVIVRQEFGGSHFLVFKDWNKFYDHMYSLPPNQRCFHELIHGDDWSPFVDIDSDCEIDLESEDFKELQPKLVCIFNGLVADHALMSAGRSVFVHPVIVNSSGFSKIKGFNKFSIQIRATGFSTTRSACQEIANEFASEVEHMLPKGVKVDLGVYKKNQMLRVVGCTKLDDNRFSSAVFFGTTLEKSQLQNLTAFSSIGDYGQKKIVIERAKKQTVVERPVVKEANPNLVETVLELAQKYIVGYELKNIVNESLIRLSQTGNAPECPLCCRKHTSDALFISFGGKRAKLWCYRNEKKTSIDLGSIDRGSIDRVDDSEENPKQKTKKTAHQIAQGIFNQKHISRMPNVEGYESVTYCEKYMKEYPMANTLLIKAGKGLGKTKQLREFVKKNFVDATIVALSARKSFVTHFIKSFPDFQDYSNLSGPIVLKKGTKVIVQLESLHRLDMSATSDAVMPDILIMDESESVEQQFNSGKHGTNYNATCANFKALIKYSEHVIAMDANLSDRTVQVMEPRKKFQSKMFIHNTEQINKHSVEIATDEGTWRSRFMKAVLDGQRIVVAGNSKKEVDALFKQLETEYPNELALKKYTKDTLQSEKIADIKNIEEVWSELDIVLYTPTITAGVSYEKDHFDVLFGYFRQGSAPAMQCDQMLSRVRSLSKSKMCLYIDTKSVEGWMSVRDVLESAHNRRSALAKDDQAVLKQLYHKIAKDGSCKFANQYFLNLWAMNVAEVNHSRNSLFRELLYLLREAGHDISLLEKEVDLKVEESIKLCKAQLKSEEEERIANAPDIDQVEQCRLQEKQAFDGLNPDESATLTRAFLLKAYGIERDEVCKKDDNGNEDLYKIDSEWVKHYNCPYTRSAYNNIHAIVDVNGVTNCDDFIVSERLEAIRERELHYATAHAKSVMGIQQKITYNKHKIAMEMFNIAGFDEGFLSTNLIDRASLLQSIKSNAKRLTELYPIIKKEFPTCRSKCPNFDGDNLQPMLSYVNYAIENMYQHTVTVTSKTGKGREIYRVKCLVPFDEDFRPFKTCEQLVQHLAEKQKKKK